MASTRPSDSAVKPSVVTPRTQLAVTVLSGGPSAEREISLESGRAVADALQASGHQVWVEDISASNLGALARQVDVVFIALHGAFGEDGEVQRILERRKLAYTGSGPEACELAMNKPQAKARFAAAGLSTPRWDTATRSHLREALACWSLPVVVKPSREGSSLSCFVVTEFDDLRARAEQVLERYGECLIEEFIPGLELTVGVLGDRALPPIEIRTPRPFYDFDAKYRDDRTEYRFDIDLPSAFLLELQEMSLRAHRCLGCRDYSRVDWRVDPAGPTAYILEVNAAPGMTSHSLLPKAAAQAGISMPALCDELIRAATARRPVPGV